MRAYLLGPLLGIVFGWLALRGLEWRLVWESFSEVSLSYVGLALLVFLLGSYVRAFRWQLLFVDTPVRAWRLFWIDITSTGINSVLPLRVGGEAFIFGFLSLRDRLNAGQVFMTILAARMLDSSATGVLLILGLALYPQLAPFRIVVGVALGIGAMYLAALLFVSRQLGKAPSRSPVRFLWTVYDWLRRFPFFRNLSLAVTGLGQHKGRLLGSTALTFVTWISFAASAWLLTLALGLHAPVVYIASMVIITSFSASLIPGLPAAIGTFHFFSTYILTLYGLDKEDALAYALLFHLLFYLPNILITLGFLTKEGADLTELTRYLRRWREVFSAHAKPKASGE